MNHPCFCLIFAKWSRWELYNVGHLQNKRRSFLMLFSIKHFSWKILPCAIHNFLLNEWLFISMNLRLTVNNLLFIIQYWNQIMKMGMVRSLYSYTITVKAMLCSKIITFQTKIKGNLKPPRDELWQYSTIFSLLIHFIQTEK